MPAGPTRSPRPARSPSPSTRSTPGRCSPTCPASTARRSTTSCSPRWGGCFIGGWGATLKSVKEQLRAVPHRGLGYGALRYLAHETPAAAELARGPRPQVSFNYLGQFDWSNAPGGGLYRAVRGGLESDVGPDEARVHVLDIVGRVERRCLELTWHYSEDLHREATIRALADELLGALHDIIAHCAEPDAGGRSPSDFPLARMDQATVDALVGNGRDVEDRKSTRLNS